MKDIYLIKYKRYTTDEDLPKRIKLYGVGKLAKQLGKSSQVISMIIHGQITISEKLYFKIKDCLRLF